MGLSGWLSDKESTCQARDVGLILGWRRSPGEGTRQSNPIFLPGKSHGQGSLAGYSPWGCKRVGHDLATKKQQQQYIHQFSSAQLSHSVMSTSLQPHELQHVRPLYHQLPEFTQTHVHRVGDAIQPSHPLSSPSPPATNPSQHQSLFQ